MSTYLCPKGHDSTEADYCSECGAKIQVTPISASEVNHSNGSGSIQPAQMINCPDCTTPHDPTEGDYCEICGYNFATGAHGEVPVKQPVSSAMGSSTGSDVSSQKNTSTNVGEDATVNTPVNDSTDSSEPTSSISTPRTSQTLDSISSPTSTTGWSVVISVDPALRDPNSPPAPSLEAIALPLEKTVHLVGRTSQMRAIHPEIALDFDDAVSHRHGLLTIQPDGSLIYRDIGSSNGTKLNGVEVTVMADMPLQENDELTLGHWTKLQIHRSL